MMLLLETPEHSGPNDQDITGAERDIEDAFTPRVKVSGCPKDSFGDAIVSLNDFHLYPSISRVY